MGMLIAGVAWSTCVSLFMNHKKYESVAAINKKYKSVVAIISLATCEFHHCFTGVAQVCRDAAGK